MKITSSNIPIHSEMKHTPEEEKAILKANKMSWNRHLNWLQVLKVHLDLGDLSPEEYVRIVNNARNNVQLHLLD